MNQTINRYDSENKCPICSGDILTGIVLSLLLLATLVAKSMPPSTTRTGVGNLDGALNQTLGVQADWDACDCRVGPGVVHVKEGLAIAVRVTGPEKLQALGIAEVAEGDAMEITWLGGSRWRLKHPATGKTISWKWAIPPVKKGGGGQ